MIQLGGMILVMVGAAATPYVKKAMDKYQSRGGSKAKVKKIIDASNDKMLEETESHSELAIAAEEERHKLRFILTTGTMGIAVMAQTSFIWLTPLSYLLIGYFSANIFKEAATALFKEKKIKVDILDTGVILLTLMFGQIGAAAFMVWILDLADMLLQKTTKKSQKYITDIFGEQPRFAWLLVDGSEVQTEVKDLKKGDIVVVGTGESIPVDGVIIDGGAMIDQQSLTGESTPADKQENEHVFASTVIVAGKINVKVEETGKNTLASQVISIINEASGYDVKLQSVGEKMADNMVIPTIGLGAMGTNPRYHWFGEIKHWQIRQQYARCHLMVLSSIMEGGANVISEATVAGLPVIASDIVGSIGLLGEDYSGYYPVKDTNALRNLLIKAENDLAFMQQLEEQCNQRAKLFTPAMEGRQWKKLLEKMELS